MAHVLEKDIEIRIHSFILLITPSLTFTACLGEYTGVQSYVAVGGRSVAEDVQTLRRGGIHVVCGTPGRINDLINRNALHVRDVRILVLDEADVMLSIGFKEQVSERKCVCVCGARIIERKSSKSRGKERQGEKERMRDNS